MLPSVGMRRILLGSIRVSMHPRGRGRSLARSLAEHELTNYRGARSAEHEGKNGSRFASRDAFIIVLSPWVTWPGHSGRARKAVTRDAPPRRRFARHERTRIFAPAFTARGALQQRAETRSLLIETLTDRSRSPPSSLAPFLYLLFARVTARSVRVPANWADSAPRPRKIDSPLTVASIRATSINRQQNDSRTNDAFFRRAALRRLSLRLPRARHYALSLDAHLSNIVR